MQACLGRLYTDTPFRKLFRLSPEAALEGYRLTGHERSVIGSIDARTLEVLARRLEDKAREWFAGAYPLLAELDGAEFTRLFSRYYQVLRTNPYTDRLAQAVCLGRFLEESLAADTDAPAYAADVARYERLLAQARSAWQRVGRPRAEAPARPDSRPRLAAGAELVTFPFDVDALARTLRAGQGVPAASERSYVVYARPVTGRPGWLEVEPLTLFLLEQCDGRRSVRDIAHACEAKTPPGGGLELEDDVLYTVRHFQETGILTTGHEAVVPDRGDRVTESW